MIKILELFGGIGSPRCALRNIGIPVKAIDYVEIDEKAVRSYNAMFSDELEYKTQSVVGWNLKPDILIHGSPCQDFSIAGHQGKATAEAGRINRGKGADKGSGTRSSLMWETIHIIEQMGEWKPKYVIWENVKNVLSRYMRVNFNRYLSEMERLGYSNNFEVLDAREFGLPQARERVFTVSVLGNEKFSFDDLIKTPMRNINDFLLSDAPQVYDVTQPSVLEAIGKKGIRRATVIEDYAFTITARQDRTPAQSIQLFSVLAAYVYVTHSLPLFPRFRPALCVLHIPLSIRHKLYQSLYRPCRRSLSRFFRNMRKYSSRHNQILLCCPLSPAPALQLPEALPAACYRRSCAPAVALGW